MPLNRTSFQLKITIFPFVKIIGNEISPIVICILFQMSLKNALNGIKEWIIIRMNYLDIDLSKKRLII